MLPSIEEQREQVPLVVEVAMIADGAIIAFPDELAADLANRAEARQDAPVLLRVRPGDWHFIDREEIKRLAMSGSLTSKASEAQTKGPVPVLFRDQSLEDALHAVGDWPAVPVVEPG